MSISLMDFNDQYDRLFQWFQIRNPDKKQAITAYQRIGNYPLAALEYAVTILIDDRKPTAGNFPTINEIINFMAQWLDSHPDEKFKRMTFDPIDDPTYPIGKLWEGFNVLKKFGVKSFQSWADANRMPRNDRERVINKARATGDMAAEMAAALIKTTAQRMEARI